MTIYIYDGTFGGFLTALATTMKQGVTPSDFVRSAPAADLFQKVVPVDADEEIYKSLYKEIVMRISTYARRNVHMAFLSDAHGSEMAIYRYLQMGWQVGKGLDSLLADDVVRTVHRLTAKVAKEAHRFEGFVRFKEVAEGFYYASIEPDHNILPLTGPHFSSRFADQHWMIHDEKRGQALVHNAGDGKALLMPMDIVSVPTITGHEAQCQELWRRYFEHIAIGSRTNRRLQANHVPLRYRKKLVEFDP